MALIFSLAPYKLLLPAKKKKKKKNAYQEVLLFRIAGNYIHIYFFV